MIRPLVIIMVLGSLLSCNQDEASARRPELLKAFMGSNPINISGPMTEGLPADIPITLLFSVAVDETTSGAVTLRKHGILVDVDLSVQEKTVTIFPVGTLQNNTVYSVEVTDGLRSTSGAKFSQTELLFRTKQADLELLSVVVDGDDIGNANAIQEVALNISMSFTFSAPVDVSSFEEALEITGPELPSIMVAPSNDDKTITITSSAELPYLRKFNLSVANSLVGVSGEKFQGYALTFYTDIDPEPKFPLVSDEELLTKIQQQTFKYFWDFVHPVSGLARERNTSGNLVTSGGSGFGIMTIPVGIERGFITRQQGVDRLETIVDFLGTADRFHGAWSHWLDGTTGEVIPFSPNDDGGDLVETAFLIQGLLTARQYLDAGNEQEASIISKINVLWESVEWDWYTQDGQDVLYWHWSPNFGWEKNHKIQGWNEALIIYVLAASSPTHSIVADVYTSGWSRNGAMVNSANTSHYGYTLDLRSDYGGPLFFAHYSFLGLDPRNLSDQYANYWDQNVNHSLINQAYCAANPKNFVGYSSDCWGLTASDNHQGYSAHSPNNDLGVITPTAALSSMPYTPEESMRALKFFYYTMGDRLWGEYGFYDAFNPTEEWIASSYLAIDQGPIVVMIENHRTGLLWNLFMSAPEVQNGLDKLGFTYE